MEHTWVGVDTGKAWFFARKNSTTESQRGGRVIYVGRPNIGLTGAQFNEDG